jgi:hypothetical protein
VHKHLDTCKSWHGPCTAVDELLAIITAHPDKMETIDKTELSYYKHTHAADVTSRPELFHLRKISHEGRLEIENNPPTEPLNCPTPLAVGDLCVTVWQQGWYLGNST